MPTAAVIIPTTSYRAADFLRAADELGVDLVVISDQPPPFDMGDRYLQVDCSDPQTAAEAIVTLSDRIGLDGIVAADDAGVVIAALAGGELGLLANPPEAARATRDKASQRQMMATAEVPQPDFAILGPEDSGMDLRLEYPLVIKPLDRTAGQGVLRVDEPGEVESVVATCRRIAGRGASLIAETFVPGIEVAVEGLVSNGELSTLAVFDKPDASQGPTFQETILVTPSTLPPTTQAECHRVAQQATKALGITQGPVHVELKIDDGRVAVIEVAARSIGGLCSRSLSFGLMGTTLEALILRNALGRDKAGLRREAGASGVLMIPIPRAGTFIGVANEPAVRAIPGVTGIDLTLVPGTMIDPPPKGDRYLGFVFARGTRPADVTGTLITVRDSIEVTIV